MVRTTGIMGNGREGASGSVTALSCSGGTLQGPMQQFFTKLRRHASLEGASPYFKIKKWKFDSSQRASSLDMRGEWTHPGALWEYCYYSEYKEDLVN